MSAQLYFNMSALNAVICIRRYLTDHPGVDAQTAVISIQKINSDYAANDFTIGLSLHDILPQEITFEEAGLGLRQAIAHLVSTLRPWWMRMVPSGRDRVVSSLSRDEAQCLRSAGLTDGPLTEQVVMWWDELAQLVRAELYGRLLLQGREAERLSLVHERDRLRRLGVSREPRWISIDDNTAGYDILSFDPGVVEPVNRLIEVKSSTQSPPRFTLTRNEWEAANKYGEIYHFHFWALPTQRLYERTPAEVSDQIPIDQGRSRWTLVEIELADEG